MDSYENRIIEYLKTHPSITRKETEALLHVGQTMAGRILKDMMNKGQLKSEGKAAKIKYFRFVQ